MPSLTEPYDDPITISYRRTPQGVMRVRSAEVKPYRRHELKLLAQGIPIVYHGTAKGHARGERPSSEEQKAHELKLRPLWVANTNGTYISSKYGVNTGTKLAGGK